MTLPQLNRLSLCTTKVLVPTGNQTIEDRFSTGGPNYREFFYTLANFAGAAQNFDGNGPYVRAQTSAAARSWSANRTRQGNDGTFSDQINYAHTIRRTDRQPAPARGLAAAEAGSPLLHEPGLRTSTASWARSGRRPRPSRG